MSVKVFSHDLVLKKIEFTEFEGQKLSEKVFHVIFVLVWENFTQIVEDKSLILTKLSEKALLEYICEYLGEMVT